MLCHCLLLPTHSGLLAMCCVIAFCYQHTVNFCQCAVSLLSVTNAQWTADNVLCDCFLLPTHGGLLTTCYVTAFCYQHTVDCLQCAVSLPSVTNIRWTADNVPYRSLPPTVNVLFHCVFVGFLRATHCGQ